MPLVFVLYALFASTFTIAKSALEHCQPLFLIGTRMLLAGLILIAYQKFVRRESFKLNLQSWRRILLLALFAVYLTNVFEFWGLKYISSFKTCFIYSLTPFVSAIICYFVLAEKLNLRKWVAILIGCLGIIPILFTQSVTENQADTFPFLAELSVVVATICGAYGWIILKQLVAENGLSLPVANGLSMLIGGALALGHSAFAEEWDPLPFNDTEVYLTSVFLLIIISNLICYNLYGFLLKRFSPTFMSLAGLSTPIFTAVLGWFFLGETVTWPFYLSFLFVLAGLTLFNKDKLPQKTPET